MSTTMAEKGITNARTQTTSTSFETGEVETKRSDENFDGELGGGDEKNGGAEPPLDFLQRALTTRSEAISYRDPGPPPDGGTKAWLQGSPAF